MYWRDLINFNTISNKLLRTIVLMVLSISNFNSGLTSHIPMDDIKRNEKDFDNLKQKSLISSLGTAYESFHSSLLKLPRNHYSASLLAPSTLKQKEYKTNGNFETHSTSGNSLLNVDSLTTNVNLSKKYSLFASHHNEHLSNSHLSNIAVPHRVVDLGNTYEENSLYTNTSGEGAKESAFNAPMYFGTENSTVIATQIGATAHIPCTVHHIGDCMVSWIRKKDYHLLTVGLTTYSSDERFSATHLKRSEDWTLQIKFVQQRDAGIYECQVSTHPPTSIFLHLLVVGPLNIDLLHEKMQNLLEAASTTIDNLGATVKTSPTSQIFESLANKINEANLTMAQINEIECTVCTIVYSKLNEYMENNM